ncbi:MAG: ABC transporter permease, partial [Actinomycetota bacterium]|nr:ABC transporter permease [Actinomycetota bacterium]
MPALVRLALRRDRVRIPVWVAAVAALVLVTAQSVQGLYPTPGALAAAAAVIEDNPTALVMNGPAQGLDTLGGRVAFEVGAFGAVLVALMSLLLVGRHTRAEEESGRTELVRAAAVGRQVPLTAALLVTAGANALVAAAVASGLIGLGLPVTGSLTLGAALGVVGLVFAGVAAVAAQVTEHARAATGLAIAVLGLAFVLRAAGDVGDGTLSWASPIGWAQASRPFAGERVWPVLLALAAATLLATAATALGARRDVGAGLVRPRPGPPVARASLLRPAGLALRLQRGSLVAWSSAMFLIGVAYGSIAPDIEDFVG